MDIIINDRTCRGEVGEKLTKVAQENKAHMGYVCSDIVIGHTCFVTVFEGNDCFSPLTEVEKAYLTEKQISSGARLACQATIVKEGSIRILSRPEEIRRMAINNPFALVSYSVEMGKIAAERFIPVVTNVIDRMQKGEMQGQAALDEAFAGMGSALRSSIDAARQSIPFKDQINVMIDFCRKMPPFSDSFQPRAQEEKIERVVLTIGGGKKKQQPGSVAGFEALGFVVADKLGSADIFTCTELLELGKTPAGRKELALQCGLSKKEILTLVNYADLCRINGIDIKIAKLLEASGVDTVPELAHRNPDNLHEKMLEVNKQENILPREPSAEEVGNWISEAKTLPRAIVY